MSDSLRRCRQIRRAARSVPRAHHRSSTIIAAQKSGSRPSMPKLRSVQSSGVPAPLQQQFGGRRRRHVGHGAAHARVVRIGHHVLGIRLMLQIVEIGDGTDDVGKGGMARDIT